MCKQNPRPPRRTGADLNYTELDASKTTVPYVPIEGEAPISIYTCAACRVKSRLAVCVTLDDYEALELEAAALREQVARLMKAPEDTCSPHPGCVYCMEAGTPVGRGEVCPKCGDRLPTRTEDSLREQLAAAHRCIWELPVFRARSDEQEPT